VVELVLSVAVAAVAVPKELMEQPIQVVAAVAAEVVLEILVLVALEL
jgi:hypothetical protein